MAWSTPLTATLNGTLTAAQFNSSVRDNLNASEASIAHFHQGASVTGGLFFATGANALDQRGVYSDSYTNASSTTSTSYVSLASAAPAVAAVTGTQALCWITAGLTNSSSGSNSFMSVGVSGASTIAESDNWCISIDGLLTGSSVDSFAKMTSCHLFTGLTPGTNIFTTKYRVSANTGWFQNRSIVVLAM